MFAFGGVIMFINEFVSSIWNKTVEPRIESKANELANLMYYDKQLKEKVCTFLLKKYGNEVYYNDLDCYITTNNVIDLLIKSIRGESSVQPRVESQFKKENTKRFVAYNPQYKHNKVVSSRIPVVFSEIFCIISSSLLSMNPYTDTGKLQQTIEISTETIMDAQHETNANLRKLLNIVEQSQSQFALGGIADTATKDLGICPEAVTHFTDKIKEIENEYQKKHQLNEALSRYYGLLQSIAATLAGYSKEQINTLICTLNCNIALCHSNLGNQEKAFDSLSTIPAETACKSKVYHLVYAMICIQQNDIKNYGEALKHIEQSLEIDADYHNAFNAKLFLLVNLYPEKAQELLYELDVHYSQILSEDTDRGIIAEYYQFHGLLNMSANFYSEAIADFKHAETYGYDPVYTKMNIAITMYEEATANIPKGQRFLVPAVNQRVMMNAIDILKELIDALKGNIDYDDIRKRAITFYTSACATIGKKHELAPVEDYIYEGQSYEDLRAILLGTFAPLPDSLLDLLVPEDRTFYRVRSMMASGDEESCKKYIISQLEEGQNISAPVFHVLLQTCLITKSLEDYEKYQSKAEENGISGELLDSMNACAYELSGNIVQAKVVFDQIAESSMDDNILENTLRFYFRNNYLDEAKALLLRIHELLIAGSMYTEDAESFYAKTTQLLISQRDTEIEKILSELPEQFVSNRVRLQLYASYYSSTANLKELYRCMQELSCGTGEFSNAFHMALCATRLFLYDEALKICYALEERTNSSEDKIKLHWLISDILLLQNNFDESFSWAKKAHELTIKNPYDQSHQAFFARAFRCNHQEAISDICEYKEEHPVVVNWLQKFSIPEDEQDVAACIKNALEEFSPDHVSYIEQEKEIVKLYKQGLVPINMLLKRYNGDLLRLFSFASEHKLKLALGNYEMLMENYKNLGQAIVVDALTLIMIANHNCLSILDGFSQVYVNYGSIATIQQQFLSYGFNFLSDILAWFQQSDNIIFKPDGFIDEESDLTELYSSDFIACCNIASSNRVPFLFCDLTAWNFQQYSHWGIAPDVEFISIPVACYKSYEQNQEKLNDALYSLMKDSTFINFNAGTILHQITKQNYQVTRELMKPFMFCTSACDMQSFAGVYLGAIKILSLSHREAAVTLAEIVLENAFTIWKRGTYYRQNIQTNPNTDSRYKADAIQQYVTNILHGLKQIFGVLPEELTTKTNQLSYAAGYITD